jgi:hypothetical protein
MEGHCSTGQSPQWAVMPMEEEEEEEEVVFLAAFLNQLSTLNIPVPRKV